MDDDEDEDQVTFFRAFSPRQRDRMLEQKVAQFLQLLFFRLFSEKVLFLK